MVKKEIINGVSYLSDFEEVDGILQGYRVSMPLKTRLEFNPTTKVITARVLDYFDDLQNEYQGLIHFELEAQKVSAEASKGIAEIEFDSFVAGEYRIKTINAGIENGEVIIHV